LWLAKLNGIENGNQLEIALDLSRGHGSRLWRGERTPAPALQAKVAKKWGVEFGWLATGERPSGHIFLNEPTQLDDLRRELQQEVRRAVQEEFAAPKEESAPQAKRRRSSGQMKRPSIK
jgi:hypothetical protein